MPLKLSEVNQHHPDNTLVTFLTHQYPGTPQYFVTCSESDLPRARGLADTFCMETPETVEHSMTSWLEENGIQAIASWQEPEHRSTVPAAPPAHPRGLNDVVHRLEHVAGRVDRQLAHLSERVRSLEDARKHGGTARDALSRDVAGAHSELDYLRAWAETVSAKLGISTPDDSVDF